MTTIAWIGLGNMGGPMAANLVAAGHRVLGFDLVEAARQRAAQTGVELAASIPAAVAQAEVVFTMLPKAQHVTSVLYGEDGILASARPGAVLVDSSTIDVEHAVEFHRAATQAGFGFLDAPVSGGVSGAAAGTLTFMVGGEPEVLARVRGLIEVLAGRIFHLGDAGKGQAAKIVNNMMLGITLAATSEGAVLAQRLGLDARAFYELASVSSGDSWSLRTWYPVAGVVDSAAVNRGFEPGFSVDLLAKDLGLALQAAESVAAPLRYARQVADDLAGLIEAGYGPKDSSIFVRLVDQQTADVSSAPTDPTDQTAPDRATADLAGTILSPAASARSAES